MFQLVQVFGDLAVKASAVVDERLKFFGVSAQERFELVGDWKRWLRGHIG